MEVDSMRVSCPSCGSRLVILPRAEYLVCRHCGSEYLVQRQGNTIGLEPFVSEQYELSQQIAAVEKSQGEGCSNVFFWIFLVAGIFFCALGFLGRTLFNNNNLPLIIGWSISILTLIFAAGAMLRVLNTQREERLRLEARKQSLFEEDLDMDEPEKKPAAE